MKCLKKSISAKDGSGTVSLRPETPEDLWHAYNLLQEGDLVRCTTIRKVVKESSTGSTTSQKMKMNLTIEVTKVDFDPDTLQVRISGPVREEAAHVRMGSFHTLTLELGRNFTIEKECWDQILLERIEEACHPERGAELAAIVMNTGLAHLCLGMYLTYYIYIVCQFCSITPSYSKNIQNTSFYYLHTYVRTYVC